MSIDDGNEFSTALSTPKQALRAPGNYKTSSSKESDNSEAAEKEAGFDHEIEKFVAPVTKAIEND